MGIIQSPSREQRAPSKRLQWWKELKITTEADEPTLGLARTGAVAVARSKKARPGCYRRESARVTVREGGDLWWRDTASLQSSTEEAKK